MLITSISIVIPAFDEEERLPSTLEAVQAYLDRRGFAFSEILVVDDGSKDGTAEVARRFGRAVRVLQNPGNRGKGYSVRHGMLEAKGDWVLFSDADLSAPIEELDKLERTGAEVAIGSRALDRSLIGVHQTAFREKAGQIFNLVMRVMTGMPFHDTQCGFKLFSGKAARDIYSRQLLERFGFDVEVLFIARRQGYRCVEVPVRWNHVAGSKVGMFQGVDGFIDLLRVRRNNLLGRYK